MNPFPAMLLIAVLLTVAATRAVADGDDPSDIDYTLTGHLKAQIVGIGYPDKSIFREFMGSSSLDTALETRLNFSAIGERMDFKADYQFLAIYSDTLSLARELPGSNVGFRGIINDDRRWWNLTYSFGDEDKTAFIHRLDRLSVGLTTDRTAWRFGRQAISWGNGLVYNPMDIFNPFDPAAVDKEYKTGDDMLYGQVLFDNGNDLQAVAVVRRNPLTGEVEQDQSSVAVKYHGFIGASEFDLLAAEHYDDNVLGVGGITAIGGAIWRGDLTWTQTDIQDVFSLATSLSYSWSWWGKNISGLVEYYHNGFGQSGGRYSVGDLARNPDLLRRIERGELFTLAKNYLALSAGVEVNPLLMVTPNLFLNLDDPSALLQFVASYSLKQEVQLLGALNIPMGPDGSEFGGIESPVEELYFSTGPSLFAQLAWYF